MVVLNISVEPKDQEKQVVLAQVQFMSGDC